MIVVPTLTLLYALVKMDSDNFASAPWITQTTAVFILCAALLPLLCEVGQNVFDPLNPRNLFLLAIALQFGFYPLFILNGGTRIPMFSYASGSGIEAHYVGAQLLAALGLVCYLRGYSSRRLARRMERMLPRPRPFDPQRVETISRFLFLAGYLGAAAIFWKEGGISQFLENREQWRAGGMSGSGIFLMPASMWLPAAALVPMIQLTRAQESSRKLAATLAFLCICLIPVFLLGFRTLIVIPVMQCFAILHYLRHRVSVLRCISAGLILVSLMTLYGLSRGAEVAGLEAIEAVGPRASLDYVFFRCPGTDTVATILNQSRSADFEYGVSSVIEAATILIPRWLWNDKPVSWGEQSTTRFFADYLYMTGNVRETYGGVSPTAIGYFYLQFGWPSVALGMFFMGAATKMLYGYGLRYAGPNTAFLLFILIWPLPVMAAEAPPNAFNQVVITLFCVWLPLSYWAAPKGSQQIHANPRG